MYSNILPQDQKRFAVLSAEISRMVDRYNEDEQNKRELALQIAEAEARDAERGTPDHPVFHGWRTWFSVIVPEGDDPHRPAQNDIDALLKLVNGLRSEGQIVDLYDWEEYIND